MTEKEKKLKQLEQEISLAEAAQSLLNDKNWGVYSAKLAERASHAVQELLSKNVTDYPTYAEKRAQANAIKGLLQEIEFDASKLEKSTAEREAILNE